jgi:hypothetical protein
MFLSGGFLVNGFATQEGAHPAHQFAYGLKWLRHEIVSAYSTRLSFIERLVQADQKHNRNPAEPFTPFDKPAQFITTDAGHVGVREDHIGGGLLELFQCGLA